MVNIVDCQLILVAAKLILKIETDNEISGI